MVVEGKKAIVTKECDGLEIVGLASGVRSVAVHISPFVKPFPASFLPQE